MYYILSSLRSDLTLLDIPVIDNLDTLLVIEEVEPNFEDEDNDLVYHYLTITQSLDVLNYVLSKSDGKRRFSLWAVLEQQLAEDRTAIVDKLMSLITDDEPLGDLEEVLTTALRKRRRDVFDRLEARIEEDIIIEEVFDAAISSDNLEMYLYILEKYEIDYDDLIGNIVCDDALAILQHYLSENKPSDNELLECVSVAIANSAIRVLVYLASIVELDWYQVTLRVLSEHICGEEVLKYAFSRMSSKVDLCEFLLISMDNKRAFSVVLSDPRSHLEANLDKLVSAADGNYDIIRLIAADSRVRTEVLEEKTVRVMASTLLHPRDVSHVPLSSLIAEDLIWSDACSLILRQMVLKRPKSDEELMDWMISLDNPVMTEASHSVLGDGRTRTRETISIRALFVAMLYPTLSLRSLVDQLKSDGYTPIGVSIWTLAALAL